MLHALVHPRCHTIYRIEGNNYLDLVVLMLCRAVCRLQVVIYTDTAPDDECPLSTGFYWRYNKFTNTNGY